MATVPAYAGIVPGQRPTTEWLLFFNELVNGAIGNASTLNGHPDTHFASASHLHTGVYAPVAHTHPTLYAPIASPYIVSRADAALTEAQNLGALASGLLKHSVALGISTIARAAPGVDYEAALGNPLVNGYVLASTTLGVRSWVAAATAPTFSAVTYDAANFSASGLMTWAVDAGDQLRYHWRKSGTSVLIQFLFNNTTIGGTPSTTLYFKIPGGLTAAGRADNVIHIKNNGTYQNGLAQTVAGSTTISLQPTDLTASWQAGATTVRGQIEIETTT